MTSSEWSERAASPSFVLLGINAVAYVAMLAVGGVDELRGFSTQTLMAFGADYGPLVRAGQVHRLLTSVFLHLNLVHLLMNGAALVAIGPRLEQDFGGYRFLAVYLLSGLAGSLASVAWHAGDPVVSAGASGALCGAIGAAAVRAHRDGQLAQRGSLLIWLGATLVFGVLVRADNAAHLGGMLAGALLGRLLSAGRPALASLRPSALLVAVVLASFAPTIVFAERSETAAELVNRGVELARGGDDPGAAVLYRRAIELEPDDAIAHFDLGLALERLGEYDAAVASFRRAVELAPEDSQRDALATCLLNRGVWHDQAGRPERAVADYEESIALRPGGWRAHYNLGITLGVLGRHDASVRAFEKAHELEPSDETRSALADAIEQRATARDVSGDVAGALDDIGRSIGVKLAPTPSGAAAPGE